MYRGTAVGVQTVPDEPDGCLQLLVSGVEQTDEARFTEPFRLALSTAITGVTPLGAQVMALCARDVRPHSSAKPT
ncbi:hypothetical protein GCM10010166_17480 [Couchioplanes caeruleus subsp. azureus]|nr:hypothetical protein GCM10010166_17480 [Couchioplanes caeruleus subsp. azureus]